MTYDPSVRRFALRSLLSGLVASLVGVGVATANYLAKPGSMDVDWNAMLPLVLAYAAFCGISGGLAIGAGMALAAGRQPERTAGGRLVLGAAIGGAVGCLAPGMVGILGFGSLCAPYAGTANILGSILLTAATYVALWAPAIPGAGGRLGFLPRLGLAAVASAVTAVSVGALGFLLAASLGLWPDLDMLRTAIHEVGFFEFATGMAALLGAAIGAFIGTAAWVYHSLVLTLGLALRR